MIRDAVSVSVESLAFAFRAGPGVTISRSLLAVAHPLQFVGYGALVAKLSEIIKEGTASPLSSDVWIPVASAFLLKGLLDSLDGRANNAGTIHQSKIELQVQERIRDLAPKSLERLNRPEISKDYKLVCWGGIWGLTGASMDIVRAAGATTAMGVAIGLIGHYASWTAAGILATGIAYPLWKTTKLAIAQMRHEEEVAEQRTKAQEASWSRVWPETARLHRLLGIQGEMDGRATAARTEVTKLEEALAHKKNVYNDVGHTIASVGGGLGLLALISKVRDGSITSEVALYVGLQMIPLFFTSLESFGSSFVTLLRGKPVLDAMRRLQDARVKEATSEGTEEIEWNPRSGARLTADKLNFSYPTIRKEQRTVNILKDISFDVEPGTFVAIVGDNGAGKSTLMQLIDRSYTTYTGDILINGTATTNVRDGNLFAGMKCLPQHAKQLDDFTIREFLSLGRKANGREPDEALLQKILNALGIDKMLDEEVDGIDDTKIQAFPQGLDTVMGVQHHGVSLSGGELSILYAAYMLYSEASILVFDEPEKALSETRRKKLFATLHNVENVLSYKPTVVLVTHVLSEATKADKVIYVKKGASGLSGYGSHEELLATNSSYADWYVNSTSSDEPKPVANISHG
jgi:ABC-type multidrug transport system fused ATPase/permease subunit